MFLFLCLLTIKALPYVSRHILIYLILILHTSFILFYASVSFHFISFPLFWSFSTFFFCFYFPGQLLSPANAIAYNAPVDFQNVEVRASTYDKIFHFYLFFHLSFYFVFTFLISFFSLLFILSDYFSYFSFFIFTFWSFTTQVIGPAFDFIPPGLMDLYVTSSGSHQPSYIYRLLTEYYHPNDHIIWYN